MFPYYYGRLQRTVSLAQEAQALAADEVCGANALAAAAEGRALARLGDADGAERGMATARRLVDRLDEPSTDAGDVDERTFVTGLRLQSVPQSVRLVMLCRTELIELLKPSAGTPGLQLTDFTPEDTSGGGRAHDPVHPPAARC